MSQNLFPGVTQADLDEQESQRVADEIKDQERIRRAKERLGAKEERQRKEDAYRKYIDFEPTNVTRKRASLKHILVKVGIFLGLWGAVSLMGSMVDKEPDNDRKLTLKQRLRDAFWPVSNGWHVVEREGAWGETNSAYVYNKSAAGKFLPRGVWYVNMAFLLTGICMVIGRIDKIRKENRNVREENDNARWHNSISKEAVDMMLALKEYGKQYNLSDADVESIVESVPEIIEKMSADERVYFEMLMNDEVEIENRKAFYDIAVAIMSGYLRQHPEDFARVREKFEPKSIPQEFMEKYGNYR